MHTQQTQQIPLTKAFELLRVKKKKWKGPIWRKFSTSRLDEPQVRSFLSSFDGRIEALAAWAVLEAIFNFLLRNLVFWKGDLPGLSLPIEEWLNACRLTGDEDFFFKVLSRARDAGLLMFEKNETEIFISAPEIISDADEYTKRLLRKIQANPSQEKQNKRETTRTRLARLEEQVAKLTQAVAQLIDALQGRVPAASAAPVGEGEPSEEEKALILEEFEEKFKLKTDDWRKAVILLAFPPKENIGPGYLARMNDLSQVVRALEIWREKRRSRVDIERIEKIEEARVFARMVKENMFDIEQVPGELKDFVRQILDKGGNGHAQRA